MTRKHGGIVDPDVFERVQALLADNARNRRGRPCIEDSHFLTGLVFDETGDRLSPTARSRDGASPPMNWSAS